MAVRGNIVGIDSPEALEKALRSAYYLADEGVATAAYLALALGKPLLLEGAPGETIAALKGKIWSKVVATDEEVRAIESQLHVISTHLVGGRHEIRVYADSSPGDGFSAVESDLEDVYFLNLTQQSKRSLSN